MPLPAPNLDDRRFQELVYDAKRRIQERCPEWTDHNVSDPGVTLIEAFAQMADQLIYRLNQVPAKNYLQFLDLLGLKLYPPEAARAPVTFWLSAPQREAVRVPLGTQVATMRAGDRPGVTFETVEDLAIVPVSVSFVATLLADGSMTSHTKSLEYEEPVDCFATQPQPGDSFLIGLSDAAPSCAVALRFDCSIAEGQGVDPKNPPIVWEAFDGDGWIKCEVERDETGGLNKPGDVVLHIPLEHAKAAVGDQKAGWIRCRVTETRDDQPPYGGSPEVKAVSSFTIGGTANSVNAEIVGPEELGLSEGIAGQRFSLKHKPIVRGESSIVVEVADRDGWDPWTRVTTFADSDKDDKVFMLDEMSGTVEFGPVVRNADGELRYYGAVPPTGAMIRVRRYYAGGGVQGNVAARAIKMLKSSIQYVARVENRKPATGGSDAETLENAMDRGPMELRGTRAVAARDYEYQAMQAAKKDLARVRCIAAGEEEGGLDAGGVRVLVVPAVEPDDMGRLTFSQLHPLKTTLSSRIRDHLDARRCVGARVVIEPPLYMGISIEAVVRAAGRVDPKALEGSALAALYRYFSAIEGGPDGEGWPFGRPIAAGEVYWVLQQVRGVSLVESAKMYPANPITKQRGEAVDRLDLAPNALVFSFEHSVEVVVEGK